MKDRHAEATGNGNGKPEGTPSLLRTGLRSWRTRIGISLECAMIGRGTVPPVRAPLKFDAPGATKSLEGSQQAKKETRTVANEYDSAMGLRHFRCSCASVTVEGESRQ
jgi:hypothetical protein